MDGQNNPCAIFGGPVNCIDRYCGSSRLFINSVMTSLDHYPHIILLRRLLSLDMIVALKKKKKISVSTNSLTTNSRTVRQCLAI